MSTASSSGSPPLEDTLHGKILAWKDGGGRQSKRLKDFADIARLVESHPRLWARLPPELQSGIDEPSPGERSPTAESADR